MSHDVGDLVIIGRRLVRVTRTGRQAGVDGVWAVVPTGDPNSTAQYATFTATYCVKPAVIGETVCPYPAPHDCGAVHLPAWQLEALREAEQDARCAFPDCKRERDAGLYHCREHGDVYREMDR